MVTLPPDREIAAILPVYKDCGDCTCLYLENGEVQVIPQRMRSVLNNLAKRRGMAVPLLRRCAAQRLRHPLGVPLAIAPQLVLAPFRSRAPRIQGDETMGCVNVVHCIGLQEERDAAGLHPRLFIELRSGVRILALWSRPTLEGRLKDAQLEHYRLMQDFEEMFFVREKHIFSLFRNQQNHTKE